MRGRHFLLVTIIILSVFASLHLLFKANTSSTDGLEQELKQDQELEKEGPSVGKDIVDEELEQEGPSVGKDIVDKKLEQEGLSMRERATARVDRFPPKSGVNVVRNIIDPGDDFSSVFNASCPTDYLGLTDYAKKICEGESPELCPLLSCRNILTGSGSDLFYGHARRLMKRRPRTPFPDKNFLNLTSDCDQFKRINGFQLKPTNREEELFPIAFNILAHRNAEQLVRLLRALYRPQNIFCIHVDVKSPPVFMKVVRSIASCFPNVRMASKMETVIYAGYSRLQADINCMKDNLESKSQWKYLINTAAQAYPLRSIGEMVQILKIYNGSNDVEGIFGRGKNTGRYEKEWEERGHGIENTERAYIRPPHNITIVKGSAYAVFSRDFVKYILEDKVAIDFLNWCRKTYSPDEHYWATLHHTYPNPHLNTPGGYSGFPDNKPWLAVFANWYWGTCRGKMSHGICVYGLGDLPDLLEHHEFFANKFHDDFEPLALDCIEAWLLHKDNCPVPIQEKFYRNLEFIRKS